MNTKIFVGVALVCGILVGIAASSLFVPERGLRMAGNIDRHFIEQMIPHHEGAIAMAELALEKSQRQEILSLANVIIEAQTNEIEDMTAWYAAWFGGTPQSVGHGMHMQGMEGDLNQLALAADFDKEFLSQMIVHHEMAVMMAQMLQASTERSEMKELADNIITSQTQEVAMMQGWLVEW